MAQTASNRIRLSPSDKIFVALNSFFLFLFFLITLYPILFVVSASFSDPKAVAAGRMILLPVSPSLQAYTFILGYKEIWIGYGNTLFYTVVGTLINLTLTIPCAYALSRRDCPFRGVILTLFMITMYFGGGLIPGYLNIKDFGLLNTRTVMLISGAVSTYNLIIARTFFANTIPWELHEAAFLDGCSDMRVLVKIVLPLSAPIIVVLTLYYGVAHWNSYFNAMIYLSDRSKYPLQVFLREILTIGKFAESAFESGVDMSAEDAMVLMKQMDTANMIKYGVIVASTVPMMIIYPWVQKYFAKGVMIGSVKG